MIALSCYICHPCSVYAYACGYVPLMARRTGSLGRSWLQGRRKLALSYREQQLCYRHHLPFLFFVEVQSSGKLSVKAVSVLKSVETF